MNATFASYVVVAWVILVLVAFPSFSHTRRAVLFTFLSGGLFLPEALPAHIVVGPIHFDKYCAISYAAIFGALLFDTERVLTIVPRWTDTPAVIWCLCSFPSVLTNPPPPDGSSLLRDALSQTWAQTVSFGIPYLLGRAYFTDLKSLRDLVQAVLIAAAVYLPLCWFELRQSPQLHSMLYGYTQHEFAQTIRFGGYRPMVLMQHGLALAFFIAVASLFACGMWWAGRSASSPARDDRSLMLGYFTVVLLLTFVLLKSTGAVILFVLGFGAFSVGKIFNSRLVFLLLVAVPLVYVPLRTSGLWSGENLVGFAAEHIDQDRSRSLEFRLINEDMLVKKALDKPLFGWGGWGRNRVYDEETGQDLSVTDGLWVIIFGDRGLVGLLAFGGTLLFPLLRFVARCPPALWARYDIAPAAVCAIVLALWTIDSLFNSMLFPLYFAVAGGLGVADFTSQETDIRHTY